jgi:KEOPS complex subunit Pcc1
MSLGAKSTIRLNFSSEKQLFTLLSALTPETHTMETKRARAKLKADGCSLILIVEAEDTIALRATLNTYLRWIQSTANIIEALENQSL